MLPIGPSLAALAVAVIFYAWRAWREVESRRQHKLRERVAYMLWVAASQDSREVATVCRS